MAKRRRRPNQAAEGNASFDTFARYTHLANEDSLVRLYWVNQLLYDAGVELRQYMADTEEHGAGSSTAAASSDDFCSRIFIQDTRLNKNNDNALPSLYMWVQYRNDRLDSSQTQLTERQQGHLVRRMKGAGSLFSDLEACLHPNGAATSAALARTDSLDDFLNAHNK